MSDGGATYQSGRGPKTRNPLSELSPDQVIRPDQIPRSYSTGGVGSGSIEKGAYVYPKDGLSVFFFEDSMGKNRQTKSGSQVNDPMRTGNELVGTATGKVEISSAGTFIQVDWVNSYVDHNLFRADKNVSEPRIGWVDASKVTWQVGAKNGIGDMPISNDPPLSGGGGIDTTTLGYAAIAGALIFGMKKKKRR